MDFSVLAGPIIPTGSPPEPLRSEKKGRYQTILWLPGGVDDFAGISIDLVHHSADNLLHEH